jgi:trans-2,3-dihydro-3-hydroxyanthranilate isomerase
VASYRFVVADVFTNTPLQGNQLAVFTDAREIPEDKLQPLAKEIGFSETVFVYPAGWDVTKQRQPQAETASAGTGSRRDQDETVFMHTPEAEGHARIRIFTPTSELPFAGHPVLGTAFVLAGPLQLPEIRLETGQGVVPITLERNQSGHIVSGRMLQPIPRWEPFDREAELLAALGVEGSELPVELYDLGIRHVYVALPSEEAVAALEPDFGALVRLTGIVGVNCFAGSGLRWKTRMFAPGDGVPEDPATGSAAGPLGVHLARHGRIPFGEQIEISQGAEIGRPSTLYVTVDGSGDRIDRVECGGSAVVVARGEFSL